MSLAHPFGDLPITDPLAMRALAHPVRLAVLVHLQRNGPATATTLSPHVGATPSVTSWHLRHLASFGLVTDVPVDEVPGDRRQRWWKDAARGFGLSSTTVRLTLDELSTLAGQIDELIAPFVHRRDDVPAGARPVRILRHYLPADSEAE